MVEFIKSMENVSPNLYINSQCSQFCDVKSQFDFYTFLKMCNVYSFKA